MSASVPFSNITPASVSFHNLTDATLLPYCVNGTQYAVMPSVRVVTGITCVLSMVGAVLIILSYVLIKELRTKAREILVHLSLMDFMVAASNFAGVVANFDHYLVDVHHIVYSTTKYNMIKDLCVAQASFAMYGTLSSILWTIAIAVYIYLMIMYDRAPVARKATYGFYVICYGLPLIPTLWFALTGKLGYSAYGGSGWCSLIVKDLQGVDKPLVAVFGNDMWIYLTIILVPVLFVSIHFYLRSEVMRRGENISLTRSITSTVQSVELKLLFIPIFFILLRIWSLLLGIIEVEAHGHLSCAAILFFLHMGGIGDSGQGIANAILFCFLTPKVRRRFLQLLLCYCCWHKNTLRDSYASSTSQSGHLYGTITVPHHELSDNSQTPSFINDQEDTKSLLLKT